MGKHIRQFLHKNNVRRFNGKGKTKKRAHVQICFLLIRRKSVLHVQFVFLLIRSITLEAIFIVVPRLASQDLIFFVYTYYKPELRF